MQDKLYKYCPKCKKAVAVIKNGNRKNGKQCYLCKCGRQFTDRKYPIEMRELASKICRLKEYSFRAVAKMFKISPNTVRKWVKEYPTSSFSYQLYLELLQNYKKVCENIRSQTERFAELNDLNRAAKEYKKLKGSQAKLYSATEKNNYSYSINYQIQKNHQQIMDLLKPYRERYTNFENIKETLFNLDIIQKNLHTVKIDISNQRQIKSDLEKKTPIAREVYAIDEIIKALEILQNQK